MEFILNQFVKKSSSKSNRPNARLGAKRLIRKNVEVGVETIPRKRAIKRPRKRLGSAVARGVRLATRLTVGASVGLGKLATLILIGRL